MTNVTIPASVTNIGDSVFLGCSALTSIELPSDITNIGAGVFSGCSSLKSIEIPSGVISIGNSTFSGCSSLEAVQLPSGITSIGAYAFSNCSGLTSIEIPRSLESTGTRAFTGCESLNSIYYTGTEEEWNNIEIGEYDIPEGVTIYYEWSKDAQKEETDDGSKLYIGSEDISLSQYSYTYDGKEHRPKVIIKDLSETSDYEVTYSNNVNVGTATVTITGKGKYVGTVTRTFTIKPAEKTEEKPTEPLNEKPSKVKSLQQKKSYSTSGITLTWSKVDGAEGYEVYRETSKNGKYTKVASVTKTSYKDSKLKAGKTYYYKVCAYKTVDRSRLCGDYSAIIAAGTQTTKPSLKVTAGKKKTTLTWKKVTGADGYEVCMSIGKKGKYKKIKTTNAKTVKYTKSKLTKGKKYFFKIRTYRTVGGKKIYSSWSAVKSVKVK